MFMFGRKNKAFYSLSEFPEFLHLASQFQVIVEELKQNQTWINWGSDDYDPSGHCKFLTGNWTICPVYFGKYNPQMLQVPGMEPSKVQELIQSLPERFPKTTNLLKEIKSLNFSAFSRLHPQSNLAPHSHDNPFSLIFHLGLIIPEGNTCGLCVDGKNHIWTKPGDAVIFDDTLEHSAWNNSNEERIVLYIDFHEPEHASPFS
jgi:hypothetical protein